MLLWILYTGQPNRTQEQRTEAIPGKEPVCEPSSAASDTPLLTFGSLGCCVLNQLLIWVQGFIHPPAVSLGSHPAWPQELSPPRQKLAVWMWSCLGSVR